ncbi:MAG: hypothetical protein IH623_18680 [Verrucomicrobia bacterium]|nr:hypothetical protein [Verrucomicrobiota bacterium]
MRTSSHNPRRAYPRPEGRILEVGLVLVIGIMLAPEFLDLADLWFVPVLLLIIRPLAVGLGLAGMGTPPSDEVTTP